MSAREIGTMLNAQAESLALALFPAARKAGGFVCIGSVDGEPGDSLKITVNGARAGSWADYSRSPNEAGGKGDMLKLVSLTVAPPDPADRQPLAAAVRWGKGWLGIDSLDPDALERQRRRANAAAERAEARRAGEVRDKTRNAERLWLAAAPLPGTPAMRYLEGRGIDFARIGRVPRALRCHDGIKHAETGDALHPAMVSAFVDLEGKHAGTHVTWLERRPNGEWIKLRGVESAKKIFGPKYWGAHIPINKGTCRATLRELSAGTAIECSEGIEDALTFAMAHPEARVVAAGTLGNIGQMALPAQAGDFTILAQRDAVGSHADRALEAAIAKQQEQARAQAGAEGAPRKVRCRWPAEGFKDFNDQLRGVRMVEAA